MLPMLALICATAAPRQVGVWIMTMFDKADKFGHWGDVVRRGGAMPIEGPTSGSDPVAVAKMYQDIRDAGIDYVLMDDTNTVFVDERLIDKAIEAWFDYGDKQPADKRLQIAIAAGGELNQHDNPYTWHKAVDYLFDKYANRPSAMRVGGKPVLYWYVEKDVEPGWTDSRWTIRRCYHFNLTERSLKDGGWGYGAHDSPRPDNLPCASIQPGWDLGPPGWPREGGELYARRWSRALASHAGSILLSDWNGWNEGTALAESSRWTDTYGTPCPDWYIQYTREYVRLFKGKLTPGDYFRVDGQPDVFLYSGGRFVYQNAYPHKHPVLVVPPNFIKGLPPSG